VYVFVLEVINIFIFRQVAATVQVDESFLQIGLIDEALVIFVKEVEGRVQSVNSQESLQVNGGSNEFRVVN
jgi:hypothetical protein